MDENNIKWFKEIGDIHIPEIGYKAARLAELTRAHFPIPRGFVINSKYYFSFLQKNNLKEKINDILSRINYSDKEDIKNKSKDIKNLFFKTRFDDSFITELAKMYIKIGETKVGWLNSKVDEYIAIRVSITSEDYLPKDLDIIEKYSGFINIKGINEICNHIKECWASLYAPEILEYKHKKGMLNNKIGIAIIIQKMVNASHSGIMITTKEIAGNKNTIIEAIYGFGGSSLISELTPDHYESSKKTLQIIKKTKSKQEWKLKRLVGKTTKVQLEPKEHEKYKLETSDVKELTSISKKLELYFGVPLYVDWVIEKAYIYLLSADPLDPSLKKIKKKKTKKDSGFQDKMDSFKKEIIVEGIPVSEGVVNGIVKIIKKPKDLEEIDENTILVAKMTNLEMTPYLRKAKGIITDAGSSICHAALIAKKYDIPCIVHTEYATTMLNNGQSIQVNGNLGKIYKLTGIQVVKMDDSKNNLNKNNNIKIKKKEPEYPETITKTIINLRNFEQLNKINFTDINGFLVTLKSLFSSEELSDILSDKALIVNHIKSKLKILLSNIDDKLIYYKINTHSDNLLDIRTASYELEAILEIDDNKKINILLDNMKSTQEITPIKEISDNNLGVVISELKESMVEDYISKGVDCILFDIYEIDSSRLKIMINICKENKINRLVDIKEAFTNEDIKKLVELKVNTIVIDESQLHTKEIIYKKEQELLKNLLSV